MSDFNVMDMLDDYSMESGIDAKDIFKKKEPAPVVEEQDDLNLEEVDKKDEEAEDLGIVMPDLPEFKQSGIVYSKDDFIEQAQPLKNAAEEELKENTELESEELDRKFKNIEEAKRRHGIIKLQIPPGEMQVKFLLAAGEPNHEEAQELLDSLIAELEQTYPAMILEREGDIQPSDDPGKPRVNPIINNEDLQGDTIEGVDTPEAPVNNDVLKVVVNKEDVSALSWSAEEAAKIRKSRTIELNIVEGIDLDFGSIDYVPDNAVDAILNTYERRTNDIAAPLPASKYRAVFTGLTYPEVIDLSSANEINSIDGERLKWTIVFNHMKNVSIGPWEEYIMYVDNSGKEVRIKTIDQIPNDIPERNIHPVTKFEDFMRKTSYLDLEFCLWKILCATAMDKEVITIDCHSDVGHGVECGNTYDWIYSPNDLLLIDSVPEVTLKEMEETVNAKSMEDAVRIYNTSPVTSNNYVTLHSSGFRVVYGHISAYDYVENLLPRILENNKLMKPEEGEADPASVSRSLIYTLLQTTRYVLVPSSNGRYTLIKGIDNLEKMISMLDEIDCETLVQLNTMMTTPYQFKFSLRDIVCPKCKNRSMIPITSMTRLLFIVARSLSSVDITLKRN